MKKTFINDSILHTIILIHVTPQSKPETYNLPYTNLSFPSPSYASPFVCSTLSSTFSGKNLNTQINPNASRIFKSQNSCPPRI